MQLGTKAALGLLRAPGSAAALQQLAASTSFGVQQFRGITLGDKVPEFWGKPSRYTEGTDFLGTPKNHMDLVKKRPLSPDIVELDGKQVHYKMPWVAISSITNRVTGVALSVGFAGASFMALRGSLDPVVHSIASSPVLGFPVKFLISYTLIYHYLGGLRHAVWDHAKIGNQADRTSLLELPKAEMASKAMVLGSAGIALVLAFL